MAVDASDNDNEVPLEMKLLPYKKRSLDDDSNSFHISVKKLKVDDYDDGDDIKSSRADKPFSKIKIKKLSKKELALVEKSEEKRLQSLKRDIDECSKELVNKKVQVRCVKNINEIHNKVLVKIAGRIESERKDFESKKKQFESRVKKLDSKGKQSERQEKELESKKKQFEAQVKEFESKEKEFEARVKKLKSKEKQFESRVKDFESIEVEFQGEVNELKSKKEEFESQIKEFKSKTEREIKKLKLKKTHFENKFISKEKEFEGKLMVLESKEKQQERMLKEFESKEEKFEGQVKEFQLKIEQFEERVKELESKEKQLEGQVKDFESKKQEFEGQEKQYERRLKEFESKKAKFEGQVEELQLKNKHFESRVKELESKKKQFQGCVMELESKVKELKPILMHFESRAKDFQSEEKHFQRVNDLESKDSGTREQVIDLEDFESREKQYEAASMITFEEEKESDNQLSLTTIAGRSTEFLPSDQTNELEFIGNEYDFQIDLRGSLDPSKLILDIIQKPIISRCRNGESDVIIDRSHIFLLEQLMRISPNVKPHVREEALKLALDLKAIIMISENTENSGLVLGFLLLVSIYGLVPYFDEDEVFKFFGFAAHHNIAVELFGTLGFADKISDFVQNLIGKKQYIVAVKFIIAYNLVDKYQLVNLL